jgi:phthalate 4,5-dioxygenase oxygenase subunit
MLSREENEFLTRTNAGTPMGDFMRRFWIPIALSSELAAPDSAPLRIKVLGESLVMFRDTAGKVGLLDELCPHRLASLFFGRNEECGIRCIYHGWKFDVDGNCVDMPSEPPSSNFKNKVKAIAYPTQERGGLVWAYLGAKDRAPAFPEFEWLDLPADQLYASRWQHDSNFFQAIEGEFDTAHVGFLHSLVNQLSANKAALTGAYFHEDLAPKWHIADTDYGLAAASSRHIEGDKAFWRVNQFLLPFYSMIPPIPGSSLMTRMWVPRDDESAWIIAVNFRPDRKLGAEEIENWKAGRNTHRETIPGTTRPIANRDNDYLMDRQKQRTTLFSGIEGIRNQDAAVTESPGPIVDRSREHLGTSDIAVIRLRKRLMDAARALQRGMEPVAATNGSLYRIRAGSAVIPRSVAYEDSPEIDQSMRVPMKAAAE